jgi:hypothetical protein
MHVRAFPVMPTRPCRLCLALQNDSVFADFDADDSGRLYLVRISFDGYGCCYPAWTDTPARMLLSSSQTLIRLIEADNLPHPEVASILSAYFVECGDAIWKDALEEHSLV